MLEAQGFTLTPVQAVIAACNECGDYQLLTCPAGDDLSIEVVVWTSTHVSREHREAARERNP